MNYIVTSGLNVGDRYVSKGISKLTDGEQIKPLTEEQYQRRSTRRAKLGQRAGYGKGFVKAMTGK
jgi:membrane fusion protein (multidrug efflux system)